MKILIASDDVTQNCGIPSYNRELIAILRHEHELHLLTEDDFSEFEGCTKVISTAGRQRFNYACCRGLIDAINAEKYDIIINSKSFWMSLLTPYVSNDTKIVSISHSMGTLVGHSALFNHRYVDSVVALSESCKKYIKKRYGVNPAKIHVIFNSVGSLPEQEQILANKITRSPLNIVFAGGSAPTKTPELVLEILKRLQRSNLDFNFYWLASVAPPLKKIQPFQNVSEIIPADSRMQFVGPVQQSEASRIIGDSNIFLCPSRREGFPMALLEALRIGCIPIVADYEIANKEIITDGETGYVLPHDKPEMFVNLISDIINNHQNYLKVYTASHKLFESELSFSNWRGKISALISGKTLTHCCRKQKLSRAHFYLNRLRLYLLIQYSLYENIIGEVIPCALRVRRLYKKRKCNC